MQGPVESKQRGIPMNSGLLTAYWVVPPGRYGPLGFGVTAHTFDDALEIIRSLGYGDYLPMDLGELRVIQRIRYRDVPNDHVRNHMGPIVVRGLWYPFRRVGL